MTLRAAGALLTALLIAARAAAQQPAPPGDTAHFGERSEKLAIGDAIPATVPPRLRVGVVDAPPWTVPPSKAVPHWSGLASLVWLQVCEELKLQYDLKVYDEEGLDGALGRGEVDVAVGAIAITPANLARFSLTPPFDQGGTSIATRVRSNFTILGVLSRLIEPEIRRWLLALVVSAFVFAFLFWMAERRRNPPIEGPAIHGLGESAWWSLVTLSTVGYGDRVPVTRAGKFVGAIWMAVGFVLMTVSAGVVTSLLTVDRLQPMVRGPEGLLRAKVGVVAGSPGEEYVRSASIPAQRFETYEEAVGALTDERLDAIVGATTTLAFLTERRGNHLTVLPRPVDREFVGFGLRFGLDPGLEKRIALEVAKAAKGDRYRAMRAAMLGTADEPTEGEVPRSGG